MLSFFNTIGFGIQFQKWDASLLCLPGMNPSEASLEYSLFNLGEGQMYRRFPVPLPAEQTYGDGPPWTCLGDQNYLTWVTKEKIGLEKIQAQLPKVRARVRRKGEAVENIT